MLTLAMRELVLLGAILAVADASGKQGSGDEKLLSCKQCIGNAPRCSKTCQGYYCYKSELNISGEITLKSGCLNTTDSRSRVGECTLSPGLLAGGVPYTERFCICTSDRCNGGLLEVGVSLVLFTTAAILFAL